MLLLLTSPLSFSPPFFSLLPLERCFSACDLVFIGIVVVCRGSFDINEGRSASLIDGEISFFASTLPSTHWTGGLLLPVEAGSPPFSAALLNTRFRVIFVIEKTGFVGGIDETTPELSRLFSGNSPRSRTNVDRLVHHWAAGNRV